MSAGTYELFWRRTDWLHRRHGLLHIGSSTLLIMQYKPWHNSHNSVRKEKERIFSADKNASGSDSFLAG